MHLVHLCDRVLIVRCDHLRTIAPISLVSVILFRIVRSRQDDTALATQLTDRIRHLRCRAQALEQINLDAIGRENIRWDLRKLTAVVAAIVSNHHLDLLQVGKLLLQVVGETLCSRTNCIDVHTVGTHTHDTTQATRTELQVFIEALDQLCRILTVQQCLYLSTCFCVITLRKPYLSLTFH